jgi:hypothetical protein
MTGTHRHGAALMREHQGKIQRCCLDCAKWLPLSAYSCRASRGTQGRNSRCRECDKLHAAKRRAALGPQTKTVRQASPCLLQELWRGVRED